MFKRYITGVLYGLLVVSMVFPPSLVFAQNNDVAPNPPVPREPHELNVNNIGDLLWRDSDGDSNRDLGEPGVGGVEVRLHRANFINRPSRAIVATAVTSDTGYYLFTNDAGEQGNGQESVTYVPELEDGEWFVHFVGEDGRFTPLGGDSVVNGRGWSQKINLSGSDYTIDGGLLDEKPDLVVSGLNLFNNNTRQEISIDNQSDFAMRGGFTLAWYALGEDNHQILVERVPFIGEIPAGGTVVLESNQTIPEGTLAIQATVDVDNNVMESNEENNNWGRTYPFQSIWGRAIGFLTEFIENNPPQDNPDDPDSEIQYPNLRFYFGLFNAENGNVELSILNTGTARFEGRPVVRFIWIDDNENTLVEQDHVFDFVTLEPDTRTDIFKIEIDSPPPGASLLRLILDPDNTVVEENEQDNSWAGIIPLQDIVIRGGNFSDDGGVTYYFRNDNPGYVYPNEIEISYQFIDSEQEPIGETIRENLLLIDGLSSGSYLEYTLRQIPTREARQVHIIIDPDNEFAEGNENNNQYVLDIPLPDVFIDSVEFDEDGQPIISVGRRSYPLFDDVFVELHWLDVANRISGSQQFIVPPDQFDQNNRFVTRLVEPVPPEAQRATYLEITADPLERISESNEENNLLLVPIPGVDFTPESIYFEDSGLVVYVRNDGAYPVSFLGISPYWLDSNGDRIITQPDPITWSDIIIFSGQVHRFNLVESAPEGAAQIEIELYSTSQIDRNPDNNTRIFDLPLPDLIVEDVFINPENGRIVGEIKNIGGQTATNRQGVNFRVSYKDQNNEQINNTLGLISGPTTLVPNESYFVEDRLDIPEEAVSAEVVVDYISQYNPNQEHGNFVEENEDNNSRTFTIPLPDLAIENINIQGGDNRDVSFDIVNIGQGSTHRRLEFVREWLDINQLPVGTEQRFYIQGQLGPGASFHVSSVRADTPPPQQTRYVRISLVNTDREVNEENNIEIISYLSDLLPTGFQQIDDRARFFIENRGIEDVAGLDLSYTWLDEQAQDLGSGIVPIPGTIVGGEIYQHEETLSPPRGASQVRVNLDPTRTIAETDTQNNVQTFSFADQPDFIVDSVTINPQTHFPTITIKNQGNAPTTPGLGISWDRLDVNQQPHGFGRSTYFFGDALEPGETLDLAQHVGLFDETTRYYSIQVDPDNSQAESNETNNQLLYEVPLADLVIEDVVFINNTIIDIDIANRGNLEAVSSQQDHGFGLKINFFEDEIPSFQSPPGRVLRDVRIAPGEVYTYRFVLNEEIPPSVSHVEAKIDLRADRYPFGRVIESDETNNTSVLFPVPNPDLVIESFQFVSDRGYPRIIFRNVGRGDVLDYFRNSYQWEDELGNPIGEEISGATIFPVVFERNDLYTKYLPELEIPPGATQLRFRVDIDNRVQEQDEDNNEQVFIVPQPDLIVQDVYINPVSGVPIVQVFNQGEGNAQDVGVLFEWISQRGDVLGHSAIITPLAIAGRQTTIEGQFIPAPLGTHSARVVVDPGNSIAETDEQNNEWRDTLPLPDFVITNVEVRGNNLGNIRVTVQNIGSAFNGVPDITILWMDGQGNIVDEANAISTDRINNFEPGEDIDYRFSHVPPEAARYIHVAVDYYNQYIETDERNNDWQVFPDFVVERMVTDRHGAIKYISFANEGHLAVNDPLSYELLWLDDNQNIVAQEQGQISADQVADKLTPGGTIRIRPQQDRPAQATNLEITIDSQRQFLEINEDNNQQAWVLPRYIDDRADIVIEAITFDIFDRRPTVHIANRGLSLSESPNLEPVISWAWLDTNGQQLDGGTMPMANLRADETFTYGSTQFTEPPRDAVRFRFTVDSFGAIGEADETNNENIVDITLPDLIIDEITFDPQTRRPIITIKNIGAARAILPEHSIWYHYKDSQGEPALPPYEINLGPIDINTGDSYLLPRGGMFDPPPNTSQMRLFIDWGNSLLEADENNNGRVVRAFPIPDLAVQSVTVEDNQATIELENIGGQTILLEQLWIQVEQQDANSSRLSSHTLYHRPSSIQPGEILQYTTGISPETERLSIRATARDEGGHRVILEDNMENNVWEGPILREDTDENMLIEEDEGGGGQEEDGGGQGESNNEESPEDQRELRVLPGNPLYIVKKAGRNIRLRLARDQKKKLNLRHVFAQEEQQEAKALIKRGDIKEANKHLKNIAKKQNVIILETKKISGVTLEDKKYFTKKLFAEQVGTYNLFATLKQNSSVEEITEIKKIEDTSLQNIASTVKTFENPKEAEKVIAQVLNNQGSPFKKIQQIGLLKEIEEKSAPEAKETLRRIGAKKQTEFLKQINILPEKHFALFQAYTQKVSSHKPIFVEVLDNVAKNIENDKMKEFIVSIKNDVDLEQKRQTEADKQAKELEEKLEQEKEELSNKEKLKLLEQEKLKQEQVDKLETERLEKEKAEALEQEKPETLPAEDTSELEQKALLEKERLEQENLNLLEKQRLEQEQVDRLEKARLEQERLEQEKIDLLEKQRLEQGTDLSEEERLEQEKLDLLEKERLQKEEAERLEQEKLDLLEKQRLEQEAADLLEKARLEEEAKALADEEARKAEEAEQTATALPDLAVTSLLIDPVQPIASEFVSFFASIRNVGKGDSLSFIARLKIDENSDGKTDVTQEQKVGSILAGGASSVSWSKIWKAPSGKHTITLCVDPDQTQKEDSRTNNCQELVITIK